MEIKELRLARAALEARILSVVTAECDTFRKRTGMSPSLISVDMQELTRMGQTEREFIVGGVRADVSI